MRKVNCLFIIILLFTLFSGCHARGHKYTQHEIEYGVSVEMIDWYDDNTIEVKVFDENGMLSEETYMIDVSECEGRPDGGAFYVVLTEIFDPEQMSYTAETIYLYVN
jgi:hypothetical protein